MHDSISIQSGKLLGASSADPTADDACIFSGNNIVNFNDNVIQINNKNTLIWIKFRIADQELPGMVDSGANPNCISYRCFQGSRKLRSLEQYEYKGKPIVDANGQLISPSFEIKVKLCVGSPKVELDTTFVVIKALPFSCIIGQEALRKLDSWEVSNKYKLMTFNKQHVTPIFNYGSEIQTVNLMSTHKTIVAPFSSALVDVRASGLELDTFRPMTDVPILTEENESLCN